MSEIDEQPEMHVVAAAFPSHEQARAAEEEIRNELDVGEGDVELADAGGDAPARGLRAFLAGRFRGHRRDQVALVVTRHDGELVADVREDRTERPRPRRPLQRA